MKLDLFEVLDPYQNQLLPLVPAAGGPGPPESALYGHVQQSYAMGFSPESG